ncbi:MAG: site-specific integrase [Chloroflexi bacterium]|nr:site-specific integrase [Chloroflexota bacterium]
MLSLYNGQSEEGVSSNFPESLAALATLADAAERANHYAGRSKSPATIKPYASGWRDFLNFCERRGAVAPPATDEMVAGYLAELADAGVKAASIARRLVVISQAHRAGDLPSPTTSSLVRRTHAGIRRSIRTAQAAKAPAVVADLKRMLQKLPNTRVGLRDRALLLLGFAGAFRRSELVALNFEHLEFSSAGLARDGASRRRGIQVLGQVSARPAETAVGQGGCPHCEASGSRGWSRDLDRYAGHSLRAGLATSAPAGGASEWAIMAQTGHRSTDMVRRYMRAANLFAADNAASLAGL